MASIIELPNLRISRQEQNIRKIAEKWYDRGFSWEVSVVAGAIYNHFEKIERRLDRLEGKKVRNSVRRKPRRIRNNVVSLRKHNKGD